MNHLNPEQQRAVITTEGKILVLAGAGSGKTSVLTHRIAYLIQQKETPPEAILGLTFTNKAAQEMRERVAKMVGSSIAKKITLSTFHSFCYKMLRREIEHLGFTSQFTLYDEREMRRLLIQVAKDLLCQEKDIPSVDAVLETISLAKSQGLSAEEIPQSGIVKDLFSRLDEAMRAYNAVDFDSLLVLAVALLEQFPHLQEKYQSLFRYIMIDEYQDANPIQCKLASLLSKKHGNLFVVGDDDQSIYKFRGADITQILQFPYTTLIKLEENYRSKNPILQVANDLIFHNQTRHEKRLRTSQDGGNPVRIFHAPTEKEEAQSIAARAIWLHQNKGIAWKEIAILYRSNILSQSIEQALLEAVWEENGTWLKGIPYQVHGGLELAQRGEVKDILSYLRICANPQDQEALLRVINLPRRGISGKTLDIITQHSRKSKIPLWNLLCSIKERSPETAALATDLSKQAVHGIHSFVDIIQEASERFQSPQKLADTGNWLIEKIDYKRAIDEEVKSEKMAAFKWDNVQRTIELLSHYETAGIHNGDEMPSLSEFVATTLLQDQIKGKKENRDQVSLMTFHSAKGLEFRACFLASLEDHLLPHEKSLTKEGIEEERRLFYVALTRAKEFLTLSMARKRKRMGKESNSSPSRFLFEIHPERLSVSTIKELY